MSKAAPVWTPDELRQMQEDWRRTDHNLGQVAELHACTRADVVEALGLTEADLKPYWITWSQVASSMVSRSS